MIANIIGIIVALLFIAIIYLSFYGGRLNVMKDQDAVDKVMTNDKKANSILSRIYLLIIALCALFLIIHFIF